MRTIDQPMSWVVYLMTIPHKPDGMKAVCEQTEWDALELARPGHHTLIQAGFTNEGEAEKLARYGPVDLNKRPY